ncbi:MAG TPA: NTP transferase domain-containing protein [Rhodospirillales bacterium]
MTIPVLIFARMDSERLPGKALTPVSGRPLLARVIDRVKRSAAGRPIVVCTSKRAADDPIAALAKREGVGIMRGATADVLGRALACAGEKGFDHVVRISGDSPFIDPALIDRMIAIHRDEKPDLTTNVAPRTYPPGASVEVIAVAALRRAAAETDDAGDREHVTRYLYAHPAAFSIRNERAPAGRYDGVSLTVDTPADMARAIWIAERMPAEGDLDRAVALAREYLKMGESREGNDR